MRGLRRIFRALRKSQDLNVNGEIALNVNDKVCNVIHKALHVHGEVLHVDGKVFEWRMFECCGVSTGDRDILERFALTQGWLGAKSKVHCSHLGLRLRGESRAFNDDKGST